jgi:hypothetical protein
VEGCIAPGGGVPLMGAMGSPFADDFDVLRDLSLEPNDSIHHVSLFFLK